MLIGRAEVHKCFSIIVHFLAICDTYQHLKTCYLLPSFTSLEATYESAIFYSFCHLIG